MTTQIILDQVSLTYPIYEASARSLKRVFVSAARTGGVIGAEKSRVVVRALNDISFTFNRGDRVGLIGHNGAGKSSLLRVLAGVYQPQKGMVHIQGRVTALLDVMLGMDVEASGYENIKLRGIIMGLTKKQIQEMIPDIAEFTEMGDYLAMPVKTYSSGMAVRLAFAISTAVHPEIFLVDEVIGAGDKGFMEKAQQRLANLIHRADIFVLSTHDTRVLEQFCNRIIWMEKGSIKMQGDTKHVLDEYKKASV